MNISKTIRVSIGKRRHYPHSRLSAKTMGLFTALFCLFATNFTAMADDDASAQAKRQMLAKYEAAQAEGNQAEAVKYVLDYSEDAYGENSPVTVKLMYRYGNLLYDEGNYRKATDVLKKTLKRSTVAHGDFGGAAFELNMNIGYAYSKWRNSLSYRKKYFDRALEVLRKNGEHESLKYVTTLINIVTNMMENDGLKGDYSSTVTEGFDATSDSGSSLAFEHEYFNSFHIAERYVLEAIKLSKKLGNIDEYLSSKIAIAQAKLNVMETVDRAGVPMTVDGYISGGTRKDNYNREDKRLLSAIDQLSGDVEKNQIFLTAANKVRMEIAWVSKDESRMANMCTQGTLNVASDYPADTLYEIMEGGMVMAPEFGFRLSKNIFKPRITRGEQKKDRNGNPVRKPHFVPVCIDGRLMAALVNAPRVSVEEVE